MATVEPSPEATGAPPRLFAGLRRAPGRGGPGGTRAAGGAAGTCDASREGVGDRDRPTRLMVAGRQDGRPGRTCRAGGPIRRTRTGSCSDLLFAVAEGAAGQG